MNATAIIGRANASPRMTLAATVGAMLVLVTAAWLLVISPRQSRAAGLDERIAASQAKLDVERSPTANRSAIQPATLRSLQRAMPDRPQVSQVVRELNSLARSANVTLDTVTPQAPVASGGHQAIPLTVVVAGRFLSVRSFMRKLRLQVRVRGPQNVQAKARLYDVQRISLEESTNPRPNVRATLTMQAFVFGAGAAASVAQTPPQATPTAAAPAN